MTLKLESVWAIAGGTSARVSF